MQAMCRVVTAPRCEARKAWPWLGAVAVPDGSRVEALQNAVPRAAARRNVAPDAASWPDAVVEERDGMPVRPAAPLLEVAQGEPSRAVREDEPSGAAPPDEPSRVAAQVWPPAQRRPVPFAPVLTIRRSPRTKKRQQDMPQCKRHAEA